MELPPPREDGLRPAPLSKAVRPQTIRKRPTALIVEDNPKLRSSMSEHLGRMGFHVQTASHYAAALAHLESRMPDIACIDIGLPTESGYELCEHIRGPLGLKFLPLMVTSEFGSPEYLAYAENAGADAFLMKPFSMTELGANIAALLNGVWPNGGHRFQASARRRNEPMNNHITSPN
jgi:DNA-binding response OmpR family regulator